MLTFAMDLRSKKGQANSTNAHFLSCEEEITHGEASKMALERGAQPDVDMALILQEIRTGNKALSDKMDERTAEINESISGLKVMLDGLTSRVTEAEMRIGTAEDQIADMNAQIAKLTKDNTFLLEKTESLENHSRRNNIRIVNLREGREGSDPVTFFTNWLPKILGHEHFTEPLMIERAHRTLAPRPTANERPRAVLIRLLNYQDREKILHASARLSKANKGPIIFEDEPVMFFPDLSASLVKRRKEFDPIKKKLRSMGVEYSLLHPATLRIRLPDGNTKFFKTPREVAAFVDTLG